MNIFHYLTICPPEIQELALSDKPGKAIMGLENRYRLTKEQGDRLTDLTRQLLFGLASIDSLPARIKKIVSGDTAKASLVEKDFHQALVVPYQKYLKQTDDQVTQFKADNNLPEIVVFNAPAPSAATPAGPELAQPTTARFTTLGSVSTGGGSAKAVTPRSIPRPVPTTSDIRRPPVPVAPQGIPPATPVKPGPSTLVTEPEESLSPEQFQLRTVDDLINVSPRTLQKEPDDEKKLVGRFKQEIQDIANYSGAKRTEIVAGWKKSQIYRTYIEMGNESIQQGKPIDEVMVFRQTSGKPYLTENQFHAVSEISRLLLR